MSWVDLLVTAELAVMVAALFVVGVAIQDLSETLKIILKKRFMTLIPGEVEGKDIRRK